MEDPTAGTGDDRSAENDTQRDGDGFHDTSIAARAANGEGAEPADPAELFPMGTVEGDGWTLSKVHKAGMANEVTTSLMSAEVPTPEGGLLDPSKTNYLLVACVIDHYVPRPKRGDDGETVKGYKVRQVLRVGHVARMRHAFPDVEAMFMALLHEDPTAAAHLHDALGKHVAAKLGEPVGATA